MEATQTNSDRIFRIFMHLCTEKHMSPDEARADICKNLNISDEAFRFAFRKAITR